MRYADQRLKVRKNCSAFTLVEVLAVTGVVAVLAALVATGTQSAIKSAEKTREVAAGRNLIAAYQSAAAENNGEFPAGYDRTVKEVSGPNGTTVHGPAAWRYPFRLAQYFDYKLEGTILVNRNISQIDASNTYDVSVHPAFGINYLYVGGDKSSGGVLTLPGEAITRISQGSANILVFASSGTDSGNGKTTNGYSILTPPNTYGPMWSRADWKEDTVPNHYGNVHARHAGRAVCVFLDGSIRMLSIDELRDMRLWSKGAAESGNENYTVGS